MKKAVSIFHTIDVALNNAGISGQASRLTDMSEESWLRVINVNLNGVFYCMKHELIQMSKQKRGIIVKMSSIPGKIGGANSSHYAASKHGLIGLTKSAALEYAAEGIRINAICPAYIETPMLEQAGLTENPETLKYARELHPVKRLGKTEEIASGFIFLASEESSFITGTALETDGGYLAQ